MDLGWLNILLFSLGSPIEAALILRVKTSPRSSKELIKTFTLFPRIVSAETILFWIWPYVLWPLLTVHKSAETIQGRKLFKGRNYSRKYGIQSDKKLTTKQWGLRTTRCLKPRFNFIFYHLMCGHRLSIDELSVVVLIEASHIEEYIKMHACAHINMDATI